MPATPKDKTKVTYRDAGVDIDAGNALVEAIGPLAGGYLRPWMCQGDPTAARVFLVGANPATSFPRLKKSASRST